MTADVCRRLRFSLRSLLAIFAAAAVLAGVAAWVRRQDSAVPTALAHLHGLREAQVIAELGELDSIESFPVSAAETIMRRPLLDFYPPDQSGSQNVLIRELVWHERGYTIVVWFHEPSGRWIALDSVRYHDGTKF